MPPHKKATPKDDFFERGRQLLQDAENSANPEFARLRAKAAKRYFDADVKGGSEMSISPIGSSGPNPLEILKLAIQAVPPVKYALAVGGIVAVIVIVIGFKIDIRIAVFGTVIMLVLMTAVVVFARLTTESKSSFHAPAVVFMWFAVLLTMASALTVFLSVVVGWPADWRPLIAQKPATHAPEHWKTVEGEFAGQFSNEWDVTFNGAPFSCPPSPQYGETLCTGVASGDTRVVQRFQTTDNNPCTFYGTVVGNFIKGTYTCSKIKGTFEWHATIR
jgi:hypothetical protein